MSRTIYKLTTGIGTKFEYWIDEDKSGGVFVGSRGDIFPLKEEELQFFRNLPQNPKASDFNEIFTTGCTSVKIE